MLEQKKKMIPLTVYLTPQQIREAYHRLTEEKQIENKIISLASNPRPSGTIYG